MSDMQPLEQEWQQLFQLAKKVGELKPWEWMDEMDVFGVKNPESDQLGFVSVMGGAGEHFGISAYLGPKGLYDFWAFQDSIPSDDPHRLLEIPQIQVSFEDRGDLQDKDYRRIKKSNFSFRGKKKWPMFRSILPGYHPWYITSDEARFLIYLLEQTLDVASRYREDEYLLEGEDEDEYLVRVAEKSGNSIRWADRMMTVDPPEAKRIPILVNPDEYAALEKMDKSDLVLEVDFFLFPARIGEKGKRPALPYMLMVVEPSSGAVVGHETFLAQPSLERMWGTVPGILIGQFFSANLLPREIRVRSALLYALLKPMCEELDIELLQLENLPSLEMAKDELFQFMG